MEKDSVTMTFHSLMNTNCLQAAYNKLGEFSTLIGPFHKDFNHWTLVVVDIEKSELLYIDPLAPASEHATAEDFSQNWLEWALLHNQSSPHAVVQAFLSPVTTAHAVQCDARNCGIFAMCVHINLPLLGLNVCSKHLKIFWFTHTVMKLFLISSLLSGYSREVLLLCHWTQGMRGVLLRLRYSMLPTA